MKYFHLLRVKHYIKNFLIFLPLFFNNSLFNIEKAKNVVFGFVLFSLVSSCVYIINDIQDVEKDRKNKYKKNRPIASGAVKIQEAIFILVILIICSIFLSFTLGNIYAVICLTVYFIINIVYSIVIKNIPILDIAILVIGFIIRVIYGSLVANIQVSNWLYLTVFSFSFFFSLCKRRNEFREDKEIIHKREVLQYYNDAFLDKNMYMFLCMAIVFYALWSIDIGIRHLIWTVPLISIIAMKYSLTVEGDSSGDPIEVIFTDKILLFLCTVYVIILFFLIYYI